MTINENLGQWSETFMLLAAVTYLVSFVAFTWDLASHSRATRKAEAASGSADETGVPATVGASSVARNREKSGSGVSTALLEGGGGGSRGRAYNARTRAKLNNYVADDSMTYTGERRAAASVAVAVMIIACAIHVIGVVTRGLAAGRVPWGNMYEFCTTGALVVSVVFLVALIFRDLRFVGALVTGLSLIMMVAATIGFPTPVGHLKPALQSYWLVIHVSVAVMASGVFTITFAMAVLQLLQSRRERKLIEGEKAGLGFMRLVPSSQALENFAFRLNTVGFVMWTFTLAMGAIWANKAWGRYWGWDTKEVWTFVIWVVYAAYLHARATRGWTGPRSAWLSIIGYGCIIFNFTAVNVVFNGLHSYSGL
ncbi:c-type cytochrome biogenesis protein CcsB [Rothia sp. HC945]|uniref:c-type cytochrome biogenesis protein CcsB n=1 Tax=Rothia sp. HC945 TaxID=3171170 RepID=UPI00264ABD27|nr:c-type cytochrome biogenesis protein CcsB [Kocuria sp.]MDN5617838.1 c-type cytochrome biogenesis protein CcsB [Kocuria sp.]MDN5654708.1 c-type cytochrome biogenesis protein CcsB [Kocuria sp.]